MKSEIYSTFTSAKIYAKVLPEENTKEEHERQDILYIFASIFRSGELNEILIFVTYLFMCLSKKITFQAALHIKRVYHKYRLSHVLLLITYIVFILVSSTIFYLVESPHSEQIRVRWQNKLSHDRSRFIIKEIFPEIFNNTRLLLYIHDNKATYLAAIMNQRLQHYERNLRLQSHMPTLPCTYSNSLLFVFSTITTIGYGYIYPVTGTGKIISIIISIVGIPMTIIVIKDLAYLLTKLMNYPCILLAKTWTAFRFCTLRPVDETELERKLNRERSVIQDYRYKDANRLLGIPVTVAIFALVGWMCVGCIIVQMAQPQVMTSTAFYFIFNSLSTIGVGDVQIGTKPLHIALLFGYILVGLSIVTLFVNLIHVKFSKAYYVPERMYLPLRSRETLRNMASFDSYDMMLGRDCPMNHYATLGIIHIENKCELLHIQREETAMKDEKLQTDETLIMSNYKSESPLVVRLPYPTTSSEDVNELIVETYGSKPAMVMGKRV